MLIFRKKRLWWHFGRIGNNIALQFTIWRVQGFIAYSSRPASALLIERRRLIVAVWRFGFGLSKW